MEKHIAMPEKYGHPSFEGIGLTKREHFAAMAMQGLLASTESHYSSVNISQQSVKMADALLNELEKAK
jgi:hypothetical protein